MTTCSTCLYNTRQRAKHPCNVCVQGTVDLRKDRWKPAESEAPDSSWRSIRTIPAKEWVEIKSVTGLIRTAKVWRHPPLWVKRADWRGPERVSCRGESGSDLWAIAWRPLS